MEDDRVKKIVKGHYSKVAIANSSTGGCGCVGMEVPDRIKISKEIGYSEKDIFVAPEANLGLGCGNPTKLGEIKEGRTVPDPGSGAGFDCFLAVRYVGGAIGVDMTKEMIEKARINATSWAR